MFAQAGSLMFEESGAPGEKPFVQAGGHHTLSHETISITGSNRVYSSDKQHPKTIASIIYEKFSVI